MQYFYRFSQKNIENYLYFIFYYYICPIYYTISMNGKIEKANVTKIFLA